LERVIVDVAGAEFHDFFKRHVRSVEVLPYDEAFAYAGLRVVKTTAKEPFNAGLSIEFEGDAAMIENVRNNSPAENAGLQKNDEIVSLAGRKITKDSWLKTLARYKKGESVAIVVKRDRRTIKGEMILGDPERVEYRIEEKANATDQQRTLRAAWLSGK
jgi:predicted metalloprotease with PDZ domain